jgi:putative ABC transport system permease protein
VQQTAEELHGIAQAMTNEGLYPRQMQFDTVVLSLADEVLGPVRRSVLLLFGAVGFLLLIACANVANLLLARAEARQREIAVRTALGAGALRIVRQLLTESLVLTAVSAAAGLAIAIAAVRFVAWWNPANIPRVAGVSVDANVLVFTAVLALLTNVIFSLAPALRAVRIDLAGGLKDGSQSVSAGAGRQRFRNALVVTELALAVVLLVGAGLMLRSLWSLQRVQLGFDPTNVLTMRVALPQTGYPTPEHVIGFYQRLLERVRDLPGVRSAGAVRALPLGSAIGDWGLQVDGYVPPPGTNAKGDWQIVTDGYFEAMGERIVRGRALSASDTTNSMLVAVVNEELARRYFPGRDPIGGRMKIGGRDRPWVTIVGVAADVRHNGITEVIKEKFYVPHTQWHKATTNTIRGMTLVVRGTVDPQGLARAVREEIRALDAALPVANVRTMSDVVGTTLSAPRFAGILLTAFAVLALVLSAIGIYGVLSYLVTRRRREIGIRLAIGARRMQVLRMVLQSALGLALAGIVLGLVAAAWASRLMTGLLHGVTPGDPGTFVAVGAALVLVATLASLVPALRATRIDPAVALRSE